MYVVSEAEGKMYPGCGTGQYPNLEEEEEVRDMIAAEETRRLLFR
jgi:hypothetical protein